MSFYKRIPISLTLADAMVRLQKLHVDAFPNVNYKPFFAILMQSSILRDVLSRPEFNVRVLIHSNQIAGHTVLAVEAAPASMFKHAQRYGHLTHKLRWIRMFESGDC